jgi:ATP-dependent Clp protease ATP-binding subunit ClpA
LPDVSVSVSVWQREFQKEGSRMLKEVVGPDDIAEVVSRWTGIPVTRLRKEDKERLMALAQRCGLVARA